MHNHAEKSLLHAAPPSKCNKQQPHQKGATGNATATQQTPAKPTSLLDLARNKLRNNHATAAQNSAQQPPEKSLLHVASASECNTQQAHTVAYWHWRVQFPDRDPLEAFFHPPGDLARIAREYPGFLSAEVIPEREPEPTTCTSCTHSRKPGGVTRYCLARTELPPAYGDGHPLRQLPDDMGAACNTYEMKGWAA